MIFTNHSPINFTNAEQIAKIDRSGDFTIDHTILMRGKQFHLYRATCGPRESDHTQREYLFGARSLAEVKAWLKEQAESHAAAVAAADQMTQDFFDGKATTYGVAEMDGRYAPWAAPMLEMLGADANAA